MRIRFWIPLLLLGAAFLASTPVRADDACDKTVVDETGRLDDGAFATIEKAAGELENAGATVRVRVVKDSHDYGNLDRYVTTMVSRCPSWQSGDGGRKNNLVTVVVSMDRQSGVFFGGQYMSALDGKTAGIRTSQMNPRFRDRDFGGGISAGLDRARQYIMADAAPPVPVQAQQNVPAPMPTVIIKNETPSAPTDFTGLWWVFGGGLGLIGLVLGGMGLSSASRKRDRRNAARQKAVSSQGSCSSYINDGTQPLTILGARINILSKSVAEEDVAPYRTRLQRLQSALSSASAAFTGLQGSANNPDKEGCSEEEYAAMQASYDDVKQKLESVAAQRETLESDIATLQAQSETAQAKIDALNVEINAAAASIGKVADTGLKTDTVEGVLAEAMQQLEEAKIALADKRIGAVKTACDAGSAKAKEAVTAANDLSARMTRVTGSVASLKNRLPTVQQAITDGRAVFDRIVAEYADGCVGSVRGNGTEAGKRLQAASANAEQSASAASTETQDWQKAEDLVTQANAWLDQAESFMRSIVSLGAELAQAKHDAQAEIVAAQADIDAATSYEHLHDADLVDSIRDDIANDQLVLDQAKAELAKPKPDYIKVVKLARQANQTADDILARCQGDVDNLERKRRAVVSETSDAKRAISRAKEYMEDHTSDVGSAATAKLTEANTLYGNIERMNTLDGQIETAQRSHKAADAAYKQAKSDVSDAEEERDRVRRQRQREREQREASSRSNDSGGDAFTGAVLGSIVGNALSGSSSHHSHHSSPSTDFGSWGSSSSGGGDSGGFGGSFGGGDSGSFGSSGGGGDSGSW